MASQRAFVMHFSLLLSSEQHRSVELLSSEVGLCDLSSHSFHNLIKDSFGPEPSTGGESPCRDAKAAIVSRPLTTHKPRDLFASSRVVKL